MLDMTLAELQAQRAVYVSKMSATKKKLQASENSYDSLFRFKGDVGQSQGDFSSLNQNRSGILSGGTEVTQNCKTAQRYYAGMKNILEGIGTKIIGAVYTGLLTMIQMKLRSYMDAIDEQEISVSYYQKKIDEMDRKIAEAKSLEQC